MKILIITRFSPERLFLVELLEGRLILEIKRLAARRKYSKAMATALSRGRFLSEVSHSDIPYLDVSLILTKEHARWDLTDIS